MWYVYILQSEKTNKYYIGCTNSIQRRLKEHNRGYSKSTKHGRPWKLLRTEKFDSQDCAYHREQEIKSYKGGNAFKNLIK